jgi:hypothetical protein
MTDWHGDKLTGDYGIIFETRSKSVFSKSKRHYDASSKHNCWEPFNEIIRPLTKPVNNIFFSCFDIYGCALNRKYIDTEGTSSWNC